MSLVLRRTALFVFIVVIWALVAAAVAHASTRQIVPIHDTNRPSSIGHFGTPVVVLR